MSTAEHSASIKSTSLDANRSRSEIAVVEDNNPIVHPVILNKDVVNLKAVLVSIKNKISIPKSVLMK